MSTKKTITTTFMFLILLSFLINPFTFLSILHVMSIKKINTGMTTITFMLLTIFIFFLTPSAFIISIFHVTYQPKKQNGKGMTHFHVFHHFHQFPYHPH